jgi:hypothetical protein
VIASLVALLMASAPEARPCTRANAVPADVRQIAAEPERWRGRCVRLEGYVAHNLFVADIAGGYSAQATNRADRRNDGWLGLYFQSRRDYRFAPRRGTVVGVVDDCASNYARGVAEAAPDTLVMPSGYCHYRGGLILIPASFHSSGRARFERQMGDEARRRFGPVPAEVRALARTFLEKVRTGDAAALRAFVGLWSEVEPEDGTWAAAFTDYLLGRNGSPIAALRDLPQPQIAFFQESLSRAEVEEGETGDWHICFCKTADCAAVWPISAADATAEPRRPYVCLRAFDSRNGGNPADALGLVRRGGVREPARTAFRRQSESFRR